MESDPRTIRRLIRDLGHKRIEVRSRAETHLKYLGPRAVVPMLDGAREEEVSRRVSLVLTAGVPVMWIALLLMERSRHRIDPSTIAMALVSFVGFFGLGEANRRQKALLRLLADVDDPRAIPAFARALTWRNWQDSRERGAAIDGLLRLLPRLRDEDRDLFGAEELRQIDRILLDKNEALILAALRALEKVGDCATLPYVDRVKTENPEVLASVNCCRAALVHRSDLEEQSRTLLRAAPAAREYDALPRPVEAAGPSPDESLLRPTRNPD